MPNSGVVEWKGRNWTDAPQSRPIAFDGLGHINTLQYFDNMFLSKKNIYHNMPKSELFFIKMVKVAERCGILPITGK